MEINTTMESPYGLVCCRGASALFENIWNAIEAVAVESEERAVVALTGGSTPSRFYAWARERALSEAVLQNVVWTVSDERMVPLADAESNFGNAERDWLSSAGVVPANTFPWPVSVDPQSAGLAYEMKFRERFGERRAYDLCLLGMGDDGHTASIFPDSSLLAIADSNWFSAVEVPEKGWRLSITPAGLNACQRIRVVVTGANKAERLKAVMESPPGSYPVQLLADCKDRVEWWVDPEAAKLL
jgi:6-phosphogluconolactonase